MTTNEIKWYVVSQVGSKIDKGKILRNEKLYNVLKTVFKTSEINTLLGHLYNIGFILATDSGIECKRDITNPNYIEELKFDTLEYKHYSGQRTNFIKKKMRKYYSDKQRNKVKYGLTKTI